MMADFSTPATASRQHLILGIMPPVTHAGPDGLEGFLGGQGGDQFTFGIQQSRHVGQQVKPLGLERGGHGPGNGIGIDVVGHSLFIDAHGCDDRDETFVHQGFEGA